MRAASRQGLRHDASSAGEADGDLTRHADCNLIQVSKPALRSRWTEQADVAPDIASAVIAREDGRERPNGRRSAQWTRGTP